jgi:hypothetical protein
MFTVKIAVCSEKCTEYINAILALRRIVECWTWWYVKLPLGFKRLNKTLDVAFLETLMNILMFCTLQNCSFFFKLCEVCWCHLCSCLVTVLLTFLGLWSRGVNFLDCWDVRFYLNLCGSSSGTAREPHTHIAVCLFPSMRNTRIAATAASSVVALF